MVKAHGALWPAELKMREFRRWKCLECLRLLSDAVTYH